MQIGVFVGSLYLPWAWKWVAGPFVDLLYSNRLGARRGWILGTQLMMVLTLCMCMPIELTVENLSWITIVIMIHNMFCATQDVAIDALACTVLHQDERGLANGLMFAGATLGIPLGGACVLYLIDGINISWLPALRDGIPVQTAYWFVIGCILTVTVLVAIPMREEPRQRPPRDGDVFKSIMNEIGSYLRVAIKSFFGSRVAFFGMLFALLPAGAIGLSLQMQKTVAIEVGFSNIDIADLEVASSILWAMMCILGGVISDRLGHLKCLAVFLALISIPTFWCGYRMQQEGMNTPKRVEAVPGAAAVLAAAQAIAPPADAEADAIPGAAAVLASVQAIATPKEKIPSIFAAAEVPPMANSFWYAVMVFSAFQGLMYGTRIAVFMRIANPDVAATQFTAYMAMMNLVTSYTAIWQGYTIMNLGYSQTLLIDGVIGLVSIALLPLLRDRRRDGD
jgi:MFS family permease